MARYVAFLRGVSPTNARMTELQRSFETAGFTDVRTVLGSGNVVFTTRAATEARLAQRAEQAMQAELGRSFRCIVRPVERLAALLEADPFAAFDVPAHAKRVVTFFPQPPDSPPALPIEHDGARILAVGGMEAFTAYVPSSSGQPVFMTLLERTFGRDITTRTIDTVKRCAAA